MCKRILKKQRKGAIDERLFTPLSLALDVEVVSNNLWEYYNRFPQMKDRDPSIINDLLSLADRLRMITHCEAPNLNFDR